MWPFKKKPAKIDLTNVNLGYTQLDLTNGFDDNTRMATEDWIATSPLNLKNPNPEASGLPAKNATDDEVHKIGAKMSMARDNAGVANDGVYCPVCHIANIDINKLHQPCPKCQRPLLRFGWN